MNFKGYTRKEACSADRKIYKRAFSARNNMSVFNGFDCAEIALTSPVDKVFAMARRKIRSPERVMKIKVSNHNGSII